MSFFGIKSLKLNEIKIGKRLTLVFALIGFLYMGNVAFNTIGTYRIENENEKMYSKCLIGSNELVEGDRDAYQSNLALLIAIDYVNQGLYEKSKHELKVCKENIIQVDEERYATFKEIYSTNGVFDFPVQDSLYQMHFDKWAIITDSLIGLVSRRQIREAEKLYY